MSDELIKKLEAATEGSIELDAETYCRHFHPAIGTEKIPPRYTTSMDVVLALLDPEWFWRVGHDGEGQNPGDFRADILTGRGSVHAIAATASLAMLSAFLKARALDPAGGE